MAHKVNYDHKQEVLQHRQQVLTDLKGCIEHYKRHLQEAQEKVRPAAHLRQALEMNGHNLQQAEGVGDDPQLLNAIIQLQDRLKNTEESHRKGSEAREAKYTNLLEE